MSLHACAQVNADYFCTALVLSAHGLRGECKIKVLIAGDPRQIEAYSPLLDLEGSNYYTIKVRAVKGDVVIASLSGINNREDAEKLRSVKFFTKKDLMPKLDKNCFYSTDVIGMKVFDEENGDEMGVVRDVVNYGAGDIIELTLYENNRYIMLPFSKACVPDINLKNQYMIVRMPKFVE
jgi:16S rRNA processing protein RimM